MAAGTYDFIIEQGSTVDFELQYKDSEGNPIDLTGYWGAMQIRSNYADNKRTTWSKVEVAVPTTLEDGIVTPEKTSFATEITLY